MSLPWNDLKDSWSNKIWAFKVFQVRYDVLSPLVWSLILAYYEIEWGGRKEKERSAFTPFIQ